MQPQGSSLINVQYFSNVIKQTTNLVSQLNYYKNNGFGPSVVKELEAQLQQELQNLANQIVPDILAQINAINSQIAALAPIIPLVTLSVGNLGQVITFITDLQSKVLAVQFLAPYDNLIIQVADLATQLAALTSAINSASSSISPTGSSTVQIPGSPSVSQGESVNVKFTVTRA